MHIPIQLGGGIRDLDTIVTWLDKGIDRVILGTAAVRNPALVREAARDFPGCIAVGIDARDGKVAIEGWAETSEMSALELARRFEDAGVAAIVYTDIARDGVLKGLNLDATAELARAVTIPVIASGGLAGIEDLLNLLDPRYAMLEGVIAGRALYDGRLDPREALTVLKDRREAHEGQRLNDVRARTTFIVTLGADPDLRRLADGPRHGRNRSCTAFRLRDRFQSRHSLYDRWQGLGRDDLRLRSRSGIPTCHDSGGRGAARHLGCCCIMYLSSSSASARMKAAA